MAPYTWWTLVNTASAPAASSARRSVRRKSASFGWDCMVTTSTDQGRGSGRIAAGIQSDLVELPKCVWYNYQTVANLASLRRSGMAGAHLVSLPTFDRCELCNHSQPANPVEAMKTRARTAVADAGGIRERILGAAMSILHEGGIQALSQIQVARRADVRQSHLTY